MKIGAYRIKEVVTEVADGTRTSKFHIQYEKIGWFYPSWHYIYHDLAAVEPFPAEWRTLEDARKAITWHRNKFSTPRVFTREYTEDGNLVKTIEE